MIEQFTKHVEQYDRKDPNINRKYFHSLRVKSLCQLIAKYAGFSDEDAKIAEVVGLLHDYARFEQWTNYHTFSDLESIDHGNLAIEKLFYDNDIINFWSQVKDYDEIFDAIKYHNKYEVPETLSDHNKLLCKVIRDADKLDIFYLYASNSLDFPEDEYEITEEIKESFEKEEAAKSIYKQNQSDHGILVLAFIFDLNFKYSFEHLKKYKIIDQLYENVKDKKKFKPYFDKVNKYIDKKIREDD